MIRENFKQVGIFNLLLIVLVVIYDSIRLVTGSTLMPKIVILVHFVAYFAGILYAFSGYKKEGAKYYKVFMFLVAASEILSFAGKLTRSEPSTLSVVLSGICIALMLALALVKDLGNKLSITLCSICLAIHLYNLIYTAINAAAKFQAITGPLSDVILIIVALVFVIAKFEDKYARGTE